MPVLPDDAGGGVGQADGDERLVHAVVSRKLGEGLVDVAILGEYPRHRLFHLSVALLDQGLRLVLRGFSLLLFFLILFLLLLKPVQVVEVDLGFHQVVLGKALGTPLPTKLLKS